MNGMITTNEDFVLEEVLPRIREYKQQNVVERTTTISTKVLPGDGCRVALLDMGAKYNIARSLNERGCQVTIYPAHTSAQQILGGQAGRHHAQQWPGDPKDCMPIVDEIRTLFHSGVPMFAICLGHQLTALAAGGDTAKMKYGHRGGNPSGEGSEDRTLLSSLPRTTAMLFFRRVSLPVWRSLLL